MALIDLLTLWATMALCGSASGRPKLSRQWEAEALTSVGGQSSHSSGRPKRSPNILLCLSVLHGQQSLSELQDLRFGRENSEKRMWFISKWRCNIKFKLTFQSDPKVTPQWPHSDPKVTRRWPQSDPKMIPKWPQNEPKLPLKWPQSEPKVTPEWSQSDINVTLEWFQNDVRVTPK